MDCDRSKRRVAQKRGAGCLIIILAGLLALSLTMGKAKDIYTTGSVRKIISSTYSREHADKIFRLCSEMNSNARQSVKDLLEKTVDVVSTRQEIKGEDRSDMTLSGKLIWSILFSEEKNILTTYEIRGCIADFPEESLEITISYTAKERKLLYLKPASLTKLNGIQISTPLLQGFIRPNSKEFVPMLLSKGAHGYINSIITKSIIALSGKTEEIRQKALQTARADELLSMLYTYSCDDEKLAQIMGQLKSRETVEDQRLLRKILLDPFIRKKTSQYAQSVSPINPQLKPYHHILIEKITDPELLLDVATGAGKIDSNNRITALTKILSKDACLKVITSSVDAEVKQFATDYMKK